MKARRPDSRSRSSAATVAGSTLRVEGDPTCCAANVTVANGFTNNGAIVLTAINGSGNAATLTVTAQASPAFGQVDTPGQNATGVQGAIGVTGWALDNVGVSNVRIYRTCLPFDAPASCSRQ